MPTPTVSLRRLPLRGWPLALATLWCLLSFVVLIPVWRQRLLPLVDLPDYLALARAWHSYRDPSWHIAEHYVLRLRLLPTILFYALMHGLMYVASIEVAAKLVLSGYLLAFPLSLLALARALRRSQWLALSGFALAFSPSWMYGFAPYLVGTPFVFFGWAALARAIDAGGTRTLVWLGVCGAASYLAHPLTALMFGAGALPLLLLDVRRQAQRVLYAAAALAPTVLMAALVWSRERRERGWATPGAHLAGQWYDVPALLEALPTRVLDLFPGTLDRLFLALLAATALVLLVWPAPPPTVTEAHATRRLRWLLGALGLVYLSLPYSLKHPFTWWYVGARVPALMAPLLFLRPTLRLDGWRHALVAPLLLVGLWLPLALTVRYTDFSRRNVGFIRLVERIPRGSRTLAMARGHIPWSPEASTDWSSRGAVYNHFVSWPLALRGGMSPNLLDPGVPVRPRIGQPRYELNQIDELTFQSAPEFDYYVVGASSGDYGANDARLSVVDTAPGWALYERVRGANDEP